MVGFGFCGIPFVPQFMALDVNAQVIHVMIKRDNYLDWILSAIYASPNPRLKDTFWENLEAVAQNMKDSWLLAGDFNDIASQGEKRSFNSNPSLVQTQKFAARMKRCKLMNLGYSGLNLTWSNGRQGMANTLERLD